MVIAVLAIFLLSNRDFVPIGFWPYPAATSAPLGAAILAALALGFLLGLLFHWPRRMKASRRARAAERKLAAYEQARPAPVPPAAVPPATLAPAASAPAQISAPPP